MAHDIYTVKLQFKISSQIFPAVARMNRASIHCKTLVFTFCPTFAPIGAAIKLATIIIMEGPYKICPVITLPIVVPMDEINVIARLVAIVTRVGIRRTTSMIGTRIKAPAAPTIPAAIPVINARIVAREA